MTAPPLTPAQEAAERYPADQFVLNDHKPLRGAYLAGHASGYAKAKAERVAVIGTTPERLIEIANAFERAAHITIGSEDREPDSPLRKDVRQIIVACLRAIAAPADAGKGG